MSYARYNQRIKNYSVSPKKKIQEVACFDLSSKKTPAYPQIVLKKSIFQKSLNIKSSNNPEKNRKLTPSVQGRSYLLTPEDEEILNKIQLNSPKAPLCNSSKFMSVPKTKKNNNLSISLRTEELQKKLKSLKEKRKKLKACYNLLLEESTKTQEVQEKILENLRFELSTKN